MSITAHMVKELRDMTGAGMMDCKKALQEVEGDLEKAVDWLRQKGIAKAAKKSGRATSEGVVAFVDGNGGKLAALAAVCCETDFVARGEKFQEFAGRVVKTVLDQNPADNAALDAILGEDMKEQIATVGENMTLGAFVRMERKGPGSIGVYIHSNGKIGVLVDIETGSDATVAKPEFHDLAKNLAMQIAAASPLSVEPSCLDQTTVEREREVYRQKALEDGKPANIVEKIVEGAVKKFYKEVCLMEQLFIRDDKKTIADVVKEASKALGDTIKVITFARIQLGVE
ncbi:MAG: translation elongation factor Ts [Desulfovibrionaceae bacterium]